MLIRSVIFVALLFDALALVAYAADHWCLFALLFVTIGIFIGLITIRGNGLIACSLCVFSICFISLFLVIRALPIHSYNWNLGGLLDRLEIEDRLGNKVELVDQKLLRQFLDLGKAGSYKTISKLGSSYDLVLHAGPNLRRLSIGESWIGAQGPAVAIRTVFVPKEENAIRKWIADAIGELQLPTGHTEPELRGQEPAKRSWSE